MLELGSMKAALLGTVGHAPRGMFAFKTVLIASKN